MTTNNIPYLPPPPLDVARVDVQWRAEALAEFEGTMQRKVPAHLVETTLAMLWLCAHMRAIRVPPARHDDAINIMKAVCAGGGMPWEVAEGITRALAAGCGDVPV